MHLYLGFPILVVRPVRITGSLRIARQKRVMERLINSYDFIQGIPFSPFRPFNQVHRQLHRL